VIGLQPDSSRPVLTWTDAAIVLLILGAFIAMVFMLQRRW
jgi:hypothetical protein